MKIELSGIKNNSIFSDFSIDVKEQKKFIENIFLKRKVICLAGLI